MKLNQKMKKTKKMIMKTMTMKTMEIIITVKIGEEEVMQLLLILIPIPMGD